MTYLLGGKQYCHMYVSTYILLFGIIFSPFQFFQISFSSFNGGGESSTTIYTHLLMSSLLVTKSHLWTKTHFLFLQLLIRKPLQIYPWNDQCPDLSTVAYSLSLLPGYFPFIFTYKFWHRCLYCTVIPTFQVLRLTFFFVRGEENTIVWESTGLLDLISRVSFLFLSPFPT